MKLVIKIALPRAGYGLEVEQDSDWVPKVMRRLASFGRDGGYGK